MVESLILRERRFRFQPWKPQLVACIGDIPRARSGHRIVCCSKWLTCLGGYNPQSPPSLGIVENPDLFMGVQPIEETWTPNRPVFREVWQFSLALQRWIQLTVPNMPYHLASSAAVIVDNALMVFGGTGSPFGHECSNSLYIFDVSGKHPGFNLVHTRGQPPLKQYGQAIIYTDGYLYVVGGTDGLSYSIDVHRLHLRTRIWETVFTCTGNRADEPEARYRHELAFDGVNLYILAGGRADVAYDFINIPVFNLETFTWSFRMSKKDPKRGYPSARKCHSAVQIDKENKIDVFIMGGFDNVRIFKDLWKLEIPSLQWTYMKKSFPDALYFHSSAVTPEGCMYTFGGIQKGRGNSTFRINKLYKMWLCIPKLSEICWESLLFYFPTIASQDRTKLLNCGIPVRFVDRL